MAPLQVGPRAPPLIVIDGQNDVRVINRLFIHHQLQRNGRLLVIGLQHPHLARTDSSGTAAVGDGRLMAGLTGQIVGAKGFRRAGNKVVQRFLLHTPAGVGVQAFPGVAPVVGAAQGDSVAIGFVVFIQSNADRSRLEILVLGQDLPFLIHREGDGRPVDEGNLRFGLAVSGAVCIILNGGGAVHQQHRIAHPDGNGHNVVALVILRSIGAGRNNLSDLITVGTGVDIADRREAETAAVVVFHCNGRERVYRIAVFVDLLQLEFVRYFGQIFVAVLFAADRPLRRIDGQRGGVINGLNAVTAAHQRLADAAAVIIRIVQVSVFHRLIAAEGKHHLRTALHLCSRQRVEELHRIVAVGVRASQFSGWCVSGIVSFQIKGLRNGLCAVDHQLCLQFQFIELLVIAGQLKAGQHAVIGLARRSGAENPVPPVA